jgi:hypothetical protein
MNNWFWYENVEVKEFKTIEDFKQIGDQCKTASKIFFNINNILQNKFGRSNRQIQSLSHFRLTPAIFLHDA